MAMGWANLWVGLGQASAARIFSGFLFGQLSVMNTDGCVSA